MYLLSDYDYRLPEERIAQFPALERENSRLLRLGRRSGTVSHHYFKDIVKLLKPGDLLVINNTKVVPARLRGRKQTGGKAEILIIDYWQGLKQYDTTGFFRCDCLIKASKSPKKGTVIFLGKDNSVKARVEDVKNGIFEVKFFTDGDFLDILKKTGEIPLPPYIKRNLGSEENLCAERNSGIKSGKSEKNGSGMPGKSGLNVDDRKNYQTVYADMEGAVAAPTAGLHFTRSLMKRLEKRGMEFVELTLHVGYGTFVPVRVNDIRKHKIHSEFFSLAPETADRINNAKNNGRRVIAVGTTSVRTLEFLADENGRLRSGTGMCDLFIYPGYKFKIIDAIITNFHLPQSTLLMLVSAFAGRDSILAAYEKAVKKEYRFFSYGDAMLID